LGQGRDNAKNFLLEHPAIADEIEQKLCVELGLVEADGEDGETEDEA